MLKLNKKSLSPFIQEEVPELICPLARIPDTEGNDAETTVKASDEKKGLISPVRRTIGEEHLASGKNKKLISAVYRLADEKVAKSEPDKKLVSAVRRITEEDLSIMTRAVKLTDDVKFIESTSTWCIHERGQCLLFDGILTIKRRVRKVKETFDINGCVSGQSVETSFEVQIFLDGCLFQKTVTLNELYEGKFLSEMTEGETYLETGSTERKFFLKFIKKKIRKKDFETIFLYEVPGWKKIPGETEWLYVLPEGVVGRPDLKHYASNGKAFGVQDKLYHGVSAAIDFLAMRHVFAQNKEVVVIFQYYLLMALLKTLLREEKINPQFILAVIGETNSKKTTLSKLFFKLFDREYGVDIDFTATKVALEEAMGSNRDAVTVYDDITPPSSKANEAELRGKLEMLARGFGGNLPRKRSKVFTDVNPGVSEYTPILSSGVITGEVFPVALISSRSRILKVEIGREDCNLAELTRQQNRLEILPAFVIDFVQFVTERQKMILMEIKAIFEKLRYENPLKLKTARFAETYALLVAVSACFGRYLQDRDCEVDVQSLLQADQEAIAKVIKANDEETNQRPDDVVVAEGVWNDYLRQKETGNTALLKGTFERGTCLIIHPEHLLEVVKESFKLHGKVIPYANVNDLAKFLDSKGLLHTSMEGTKCRKTIKVYVEEKETSIRFYHFYKEKVETLVETGIE